MATTAGGPSGPDINIKVKTMAPATHELCISPQASVSELKQELAGITSIPVDRQRLIYHGRVMRDDQTLAELGVGEGHTVHLVERPADAPPAAGAGGSSNPAAAPNQSRQPRGAGMAPGDVPMAFDMGAINLGPILQNLLSSMGVQGGAAAGPAGGSGERLPPQHLLYTLDAYLSSLQRGQPSLQPIHVISLDPRVMPEELNRQFVQGIQSVLSAADLPARLQQLMRELPSTAAGAGGGGASAGSSQSQPAAPQQAQLHLALASVGRLLQRSTTYVHDHLEPGLTQAARQLADTSALDAQGLRSLGADLRRTSGLLNGAAALLVELARATAAAMLAAEGNLVPLMANTATVLELQGNEPPVPFFPQLYPQMTWVEDAPQQPATSAAPGAAGGESAARSGGGRGRAQGVAAAGSGGLPAMLGSMLGGFPAQVAVGPTTTWSATTPDGRTASASAGSMTFAMPSPSGYINHPMGRAGDTGGMPGAMQHAAMGGGTPPGMSDVEASLAWQIATAVMASLGPVVQTAADAAVVQVRQARQQIRQQQATEHAQVVSRVVADSLSRVLETAGSALQGGLNRIEQGLQEAEQRSGHEANLMDIARVLQNTFAPQLRPVVDSIGRAVEQASAAAAAAQQARAAAGHAATAAAAAGAAATAAAAAAGSGAPEAAATAGAAPSSSQPSSTPAAPSSSAPAAPSTAAAAPAAGPSSSAPAAGGAAGSSGQGAGPRGPGLPSRGPTLPSKRKAPAPVSTGAGSSSGGAGGAQPAGVPRLQRNPTPGTLRLSEAGSTPRGDLPALRELPDINDAEAALARATARSTSSSQSQQQPPVDLGQLMQMAMGALGGAGGPPSGMGAAGAGGGASAAPAAAGGAAPRAVAAAGGARGGGEPDLSGLMQMMGGLMGGGGAGGGGMGGLLQMAGQLASDPAMQPLINNVASAVLGGAGGPGGGAGGAGGLGSLLSGLLGGPAPGGSGRPSATVTSMDVLDSALPPQQAVEWRRVIEADEVVQQEEAAALAAPLSEVYLAGGPVQRQGLLSQLTDAEEQ